MKLAMALFCALLLAYLLGSISFGLVLARLRRVDLRSVGSGNIGATNAARAMGKGWGILVLVCDAAKAAVPLWLAHRYFAEDPRRDWILVGMAGAAFLGHLYPIFSGFHGGKGVATALGGFLAIEPKAAGLGFLTYALAYGVSRISSVGSLCAVATFPLWLYLVDAPRPSYVLAGGLLLGIVFTHRGNIQRLWRGQEKKL
jgi:glycerol-3-phosphate acyltransferase PlsY